MTSTLITTFLSYEFTFPFVFVFVGVDVGARSSAIQVLGFRASKISCRILFPGIRVVGFWVLQVNCKTDSIGEDLFLHTVRGLGDSVARTMSGVQSPQEKATGSRVGTPAEAPFVPEAASPAERAAGWKNPPSRMQLMMWSGSKRHVFVGLLGVSVLATIPWVLLTSGKKHDSHADYMDRAEGARRSRLSNASVAVGSPTSS